MTARVRVGVVGCGIGRQHVEAYRSLPDQFEVVAVCDVDEARAREVAAAHGIPRVLTDFGALCRMDDLSPSPRASPASSTASTGRWRRGPSCPSPWQTPARPSS